MLSTFIWISAYATWHCMHLILDDGEWLMILELGGWTLEMGNLSLRLPEYIKIRLVQVFEIIEPCTTL